MLSLNKKGSCGIYAINFLKYFSFKSFKFLLSKKFFRYSELLSLIELTIVDFPAPDGPKIELIFPILKTKVMPFKIYFSLLSYLKIYYQTNFIFNFKFGLFLY